MEGLAIELLDSIFTMACTDGGPTGCSLSAVSQFIRATSRAARFHSISLTGSPAQMTQFLARFLAERAMAATRTPTIRHLHLVAMKDEKPWRAEDEVPDEMRRIAEETTQYVKDFTALFGLVAPDLETLCLVLNHGWMRLVRLPDIACAAAGGFPMLRELTLTGADPFVSAQAAPSAFYPRLARLHLGYPTYFTWDVNLDSWAARAPGITHVCFSEINSTPPVVEELAGDAPRLKKLRHLLLRPIGPPIDARCGNPYREHADMIETLGLFCEAAAVHAEVVPNEKRAGEWAETARQEWLDRLAGGPGCWLMSEEGAKRERDGSEPRVRLGWRELLAQVREKREAAMAAWLEMLLRSSKAPS